MVDKNLFLYDLAIVAIFKNEGHYLKEWLDYHLLAGVDHFYLYNNDSSDDYKEILAPYVEENLVTLTECPGKMMQYPVYNDAIETYRFECRYMAFIDLDEFIFPKTNRPIGEIVDEILSNKKNAAGLGINWQCFGSNGQDKVDYSRGVLERFTHRAESDWFAGTFQDVKGGNVFVKSVINPRCVNYMSDPHCANYLNGFNAVNGNGVNIRGGVNYPVVTDKIVINHYIIKSREEFLLKKKKGRADGNENLYEKFFSANDRNEIFDDGILKYRAARAEKFSFESDEQRINRVTNSLFQTLTQSLSEDSFVGKLETFLTCRAMAEKFQLKIGEHSAEEIALTLIYRTLLESVTFAEIQMFLKALPEILSRPFPICKKILQLTQAAIIPKVLETLKNGVIGQEGASDWKARSDLLYIQKLLRLIK